MIILATLQAWLTKHMKQRTLVCIEDDVPVVGTRSVCDVLDPIELGCERHKDVNCMWFSLNSSSLQHLSWKCYSSPERNPAAWDNVLFLHF